MRGLGGGIMGGFLGSMLFGGMGHAAGGGGFGGSGIGLFEILDIRWNYLFPVQEICQAQRRKLTDPAAYSRFRTGV